MATPADMKPLWIATDHHPPVEDRAYNRFLRYPANRRLEGPLAENAAWAREWFAANAHPWCLAIRADDAVCARAATFLPGETEFALIAASAGVEPETEASARWSEDEPDRYFFMDSYASAVVEALIAAARHNFGAERHYSPGYRGWPVEENVQLLEALAPCRPFPGPLTVLSSGMLNPRKSQLAVCALRTNVNSPA